MRRPRMTGKVLQPFKTLLFGHDIPCYTVRRLAI